MPWVWKKLQNKSQWRLGAHPVGTCALAQDGESEKLPHFPVHALLLGWCQETEESDLHESQEPDTCM